MTVDNFSIISSLLDFTLPDTFYFIQVLKRRKENPDMVKGVKVINTYYVYCYDDLHVIRERIIEDCEMHNARAYINLNRLNTQVIALRTIQSIVDYMTKGEYIACKNAYATACGNHHSEPNKKWVVDIDPEHIMFLDMIKFTIEELHKETRGGFRIHATVPTKNGCHIITNPFNLDKFNRILTEKMSPVKVPDIQKNSPTILYV